MRCFLFEPIYGERVGGGIGLATHLGRVYGERRETDGSGLSTGANTPLPLVEGFTFTVTRPSVVLATDRFV